jgi:hypothetical protein
LSELDNTSIIYNPSIRHDINLESDLDMGAILGGDRERERQNKANQFYNTMTEQLDLFVKNRDEFQIRYRDEQDWCLPRLLREVKEIMQTLVVKKDRSSLDEGFDVDLLMQQINKGVMDLEKLALWLSGVLKRHCAPMRDQSVDEMCNKLSNGNRNTDIPELVAGMRSLVDILEAMRVDLANYFICRFRLNLIQGTVPFAQRFFKREIQGRKLSIEGAQVWYQHAKLNARLEFQDPRSLYTEAFGDAGIFFDAVTKLLLPSTQAEDPNSNVCVDTFRFDKGRILKLRSDIYDIICLEICMRQFQELEKMAASAMHTNFAAHQFSRPFSDSGSDGGSLNSSPWNSGFLGARTPADADIRTRSRELYDSLLALLQTAPKATRASQRWQVLSSHIAVQIRRYVHDPHITFGEMERILSEKLSHVESDTFQDVEACFHERLFEELARRVKEFRNLSEVGLFSVATRSKAPAVRVAGQIQTLQDLATQLAHLGLLHWRVWGKLAYGPGRR